MNKKRVDTSPPSIFSKQGIITTRPRSFCFSLSLFQSWCPLERWAKCVGVECGDTLNNENCQRIDKREVEDWHPTNCFNWSWAHPLLLIFSRPTQKAVHEQKGSTKGPFLLQRPSRRDKREKGCMKTSSKGDRVLLWDRDLRDRLCPTHNNEPIHVYFSERKNGLEYDSIYQNTTVSRHAMRRGIGRELQLEWTRCDIQVRIPPRLQCSSRPNVLMSVDDVSQNGFKAEGMHWSKSLSSIPQVEGRPQTPSSMSWFFFFFFFFFF